MTLQPALFATTKASPTEIVKRLHADGTIDPATGTTRRARPARCSRCKAWVVRGYGADWCSLAVDADPDPLDAIGEALALIAGRATFELRIVGGRPELRRRDRWMIAGHPAGSDKTDILAGHDCDKPLKLSHTGSRLPVPKQDLALPEQPPSNQPANPRTTEDRNGTTRRDVSGSGRSSLRFARETCYGGILQRVHGSLDGIVALPLLRMPPGRQRRDDVRRPPGRSSPHRPSSPAESQSAWRRHRSAHAA